MSEISEQDKTVLKGVAKYHLEHFATHLQQQAATHEEVTEPFDLLRASAAIGIATFGWFILGAHVKIKLLFDNGERITGDGKLYGAGLIPGPCEGAYAGVSADELLGKCGCVSGGMGALEALSFARHKKPLGVFIASRPGTIFVGGGEVDWKRD